MQFRACRTNRGTDSFNSLFPFRHELSLIESIMMRETRIVILKRCDFGSTKADIEEICLKDKVIDAWASEDLKRKLLEKEHSLDEILVA